MRQAPTFDTIFLDGSLNSLNMKAIGYWGDIHVAGTASGSPETKPDDAAESVLPGKLWLADWLQ